MRLALSFFRCLHNFLRYGRFSDEKSILCQKIHKFWVHFPETAHKLEKIWLQIWNPYENTKNRSDPFFEFRSQFFLQAIMLEDRSIYLKRPKIPFFAPIFLYNSRSKLKSKKKKDPSEFLYFCKDSKSAIRFFLAYVQFPENAPEMTKM